MHLNGFDRIPRRQGERLIQWLEQPTLVPVAISFCTRPRFQGIMHNAPTGGCSKTLTRAIIR